MQEAEAIINELFNDAQEATSETMQSILRGERLPKADLAFWGDRVVGASFVRQDVTPGVTTSFPRNRPAKAVRDAFKRRNG